jgi:hypothetical protein
VSPEPDSPLLAIAIALASGAVAYLCHRLVRAIQDNRLMPLSEKLKGDKGRSFPLQGTWPFRDKYEAQFVSRSYWHALLLVMKWSMISAAVLLGVVYPIIYLIKFAGR